jgi:hypothetical protein
MPKNYYNVSWKPDLTRKWSGDFFTKKWLRWYTNKLDKVDVDYKIKKVKSYFT